MSPRKTRSAHGNSVSSTGSLLQDLPDPVAGSYATDGQYDVAHLTLAEAIFARRSEYTQTTTVRIKVGTWNAGAQKHVEEDVAGWFVNAHGVDAKLGGLALNDDEHRSRDPHQGDEIGLYVLNLQEIVDVTAVSETLRPYSDPSTARKWKDMIEPALPRGFTLIAEQQMIGLLLLVYASADVAQSVRDVSTSSVGTGLGGVMGNKGAVGARLVVGENTRLLFVNSHLAAGADKAAVERRNWDAAQVVQRARFTPLTDIADTEYGTGEHIGGEDYAFWSGDLNYRLEGIPGDDIRRLLTLHAQNKFSAETSDSDDSTSKLRKIANKITHGRVSLESSSTGRPSMESSILPSSDSDDTNPTTDDVLQPGDDPSSLLTTLTSLLPHDELGQQIKSRKAFHDGWKEGPITFLPTYKYDVGSFGAFDSSEKRRAPSFCDRILYRSRKDKLVHDTRIQEELDARKKDAQMEAHGVDQATTDEDILYDYDPDNDGDEGDYNEHDDGNAAEDLEEELRLENYITYQHIVSSDHKPMSAEFVLSYLTVDPELRARIHSEVVKRYDEAENETRPRLTVIADNHGNNTPDQGINFQDIRWAELKQRTLTIANTGSTPASFSFIDRPTSSEPASGTAPSWLRVYRDDELLATAIQQSPIITLEPGDTVSFVLELQILDLALTKALNTGTTLLEDVLVLRIQAGRDHFIPIQAHWQATSMCRSVEELVRIPEGGIRKVQCLEDGAVPTVISLDLPVCVSAPRELFRIIEAIERRCAQVVAEWKTDADHSSHAPWDDDAGWPFSERSWSSPDAERYAVLSALCNAVDSTASISDSFPTDMPKETQLYLLCELLLTFLRSLVDGLITSDMSIQLNTHLAAVERSKQRPDADAERYAIQEILIKDGASRNICFMLLTTMLQRILADIKAAQRLKEELAGSGGDDKSGSVRRNKHDKSEKLLVTSISAYAEIFSAATIKSPSSNTADAAKAMTSKRRVELFRLFLTSGDDEAS